MTDNAVQIRPLRRVDLGVWRSRDKQLTFLRHQSDPHPQRWFVYEGDEEFPVWDDGSPSLRAAVARAEERYA